MRQKPLLSRPASRRVERIMLYKIYACPSPPAQITALHSHPSSPPLTHQARLEPQSFLPFLSLPYQIIHTPLLKTTPRALPNLPHTHRSQNPQTLARHDWYTRIRYSPNTYVQYCQYVCRIFQIGTSLIYPRFARHTHPTFPHAWLMQRQNNGRVWTLRRAGHAGAGSGDWLDAGVVRRFGWVVG